MSEFVEECRKEWKRLHVPDPIANEMAADLEADLQEAAAEGASAEAVLGIAAFDPRSFAASWAAERGVAQPTPAPESRPMLRGTPRRGLGTLVALAGSALVGFVVLVGAVLVFGRVRSAQGIDAPVGRGVPIPPFPRFGAGPAIVHVASSQAPIGLVAVFVLFAGIIGLILTVVIWRPWVYSEPGLRARHDRDQTPEGHYS